MARLTCYLAARFSGVVPTRAARSRSGRGSRRQPASQLASSSCSGLQVRKVCPASCWTSRTQDLLGSVQVAALGEQVGQLHGGSPVAGAGAGAQPVQVAALGEQIGQLPG